jgi:TonB-linked SusC/RagA family outer membrane protein
MKLTMILVVLNIVNCFASAYSQKVSLHLNNVKFYEAINEISRQTKLDFAYSKEVVDINRKVSISVTNTELKKVLDRLLDGTQLIHVELNGKIYFGPKEFESVIQSALIQQQKKIAGVVTDSQTGESLPGVSIFIKGTTKGTVTDEQGKFSLIDSNPNAILEVSYMGYEKQEIVVDNSNNLTIRLVGSVKTLDEVVVVGYGSQKRKDLTGSVASMGNKDIKDLAVTRIDQALMGKVAGVQVKSVSGEPGSSPQIRIRGIGSISAGAMPLYVVDGFPTYSIETLNPNDIESLDVLKDASAAAIYGSRGSNGVIIVTTKRGKLGEAVITFGSYYGLQKVSKRPEFINARDQAQYFYDGVKNRNIDAGNDVSGAPNTWKIIVPPIILDVLSGKNTTDVDKVKEVLQTAPIQQYQLGVSGGNDNVRYAISSEYLNQDGIVINSNFKRYSIRAQRFGVKIF